MQKTSGNQNCSATINVSNVNDVVVTIPTASYPTIAFHNG